EVRRGDQHHGAANPERVVVKIQRREATQVRGVGQRHCSSRSHGEPAQVERRKTAQQRRGSQCLDRLRQRPPRRPHPPPPPPHAHPGGTSGTLPTSRNLASPVLRCSIPRRNSHPSATSRTFPTQRPILLCSSWCSRTRAAFMAAMPSVPLARATCSRMNSARSGSPCSSSQSAKINRSPSSPGSSRIACRNPVASAIAVSFRPPGRLCQMVILDDSRRLTTPLVLFTCNDTLSLVVYKSSRIRRGFPAANLSILRKRV